MSGRRRQLFTGRFFWMCGFTFIVFLSAFQLFPTAPFRILALGGSHAAAGLFLGLLTYASALSAPFTGALADRFGRRRTLVVASLALTLFSLAYAATSSVVALLTLAVFHGLFWSALLSASAAYVTEIVPESRRAEGIGYWGMATVLAVAVAPAVGLAAYHRGWAWLCIGTAGLHLIMAGVAWRLVPGAHAARASTRPRHAPWVEWRILGVSLSVFLFSYGYGAINSFIALYAAQTAVVPRGLYFTTFAAMTLAVRPVSGRLADRIGYRPVFLPCLLLIAVGLGLLALGGTRPWMIASALVFGGGFGAAYPIFVAHVMQHAAHDRRGAAYGAILAAFDTGIGTGSIVSGAIIGRFGFAPAFALAAGLAALALPYFLVSEPRWLATRDRQSSAIASGQD